MAKRNIIQIDKEKCVGCGQCVDACHNSALKLIDGKAALVSEHYCDGLGACIGDCPTGALKVILKEIPDTTQASSEKSQSPMSPHQCPSSQSMVFANHSGNTAASTVAICDNKFPAVTIHSQLTHWPIQLKLISPESPAYKNAHILIAADCSAFALGSFHPDLLRGRSLIIACPKLDDPTGYLEKLTQIFTTALPKSVTIVRMEVPCCSGLTRLVTTAADSAAIEAKVSLPPITELTISLTGQIVKTEQL